MAHGLMVLAVFIGCFPLWVGLHLGWGRKNPRAFHSEVDLVERLPQRCELVIEREMLPSQIPLLVFTALSLVPAVTLFTLGGLSLSLVFLTGVDIFLLEDLLLRLLAELFHYC